MRQHLRQPLQRRLVRHLRLGAAALLLALAPGAGAAEQAEEGIRQIRLTEAQLQSFISAQPDLSRIAGKLQEAGDKPDPALEAELDAMAKKHGFQSFAELDDVAANISIVMAGLDAETGEFTDPLDALKKELADVETDSSIPEADRKQLIEELGEAIKATPPLQHKENVDLVKAHRAEIERALE